MKKLILVFTKKSEYSADSFPPAIEEDIFFEGSIQFCFINGKSEYELSNYDSKNTYCLKMPSESGILLINDSEINNNADNIITALNNAINFDDTLIYIWYHQTNQNRVERKVNNIWKGKICNHGASSHLINNNKLVYYYILDFYEGAVDIDTIISNCFVVDDDEKLLIAKLKEIEPLLVEHSKNSKGLDKKLNELGKIEKVLLEKNANSQG